MIKSNSFLKKGNFEKMRNSVGAKSQISSSVASPGRKIWPLFSVRGMSWGLGNPRFTKFSVVNFLQMACNQRYPTKIENGSIQNRKLINYLTKVSMKLFEL